MISTFGSKSGCHQVPIAVGVSPQTVFPFSSSGL